MKALPSHFQGSVQSYQIQLPTVLSLTSLCASWLLSRGVRSITTTWLASPAWRLYVANCLCILTPNQLGREDSAVWGQFQIYLSYKDGVKNNSLMLDSLNFPFWGDCCWPFGIEVLVEYINMPKLKMSPNSTSRSCIKVYFSASFKDGNLCHTIWHFLIILMSLIFWSQPKQGLSIIQLKGRQQRGSIMAGRLRHKTY